ncbi:MAG: O-antigen ligase family protein, partial [Mycoplasmataceae bacterium]|nr:O-antigen ligase family protein [Mycoplasmataceae bacterium]
NYIPLILPNLISKKSNAANFISMAICFGVQILLLLIIFWKNVTFTKEKNKELKMLIIVSTIFILSQIFRFIINDYKILDIANIICQFLNITFLYIFIGNFEIEKQYIKKFMKAILIFGVIACCWNIILYFKEILQMIFGSAKYNSIKSFFANRNQFAFFLYIEIISNVFLMMQENKKIYKILLATFLLNLFFTMSRTGIAVTLMFLFLSFFTLTQIKRKKKIIYLTIFIIFGIIFMLVLYYLKPELINQLLRIDSIKKLSGRTAIWERGINILLESPMNLLFGVGRFNGTEVLQFEKQSFTQFHNIYLDFFITGGILELSFVIYIFYNVIKSIEKSKIDLKFKILYRIVFITYFIYAFFESVGRFSIGAVDVLCFIFFISIPLLHAQSKSEEN